MDEVVHFMTSPAALLAVEITELADHMLAREVDSLTASGSGILEKSRPVRTEEQGGQSSLEADLWRSGRSRKARGGTREFRGGEHMVRRKHVVVVADNNILSCIFFVKNFKLQQAMLKEKHPLKVTFLFGCFFISVELSTE